MKKDLEKINDGSNANIFYKNCLKILLSKIFLNCYDDKILTLTAFCYKKLKNYEKAIKYFKKAILLNNKNFSAFYQLGLCSLKKGENCIALNSFINAIQLDPENLHSVLNLGIAHENCEEDDMAYKIYQRLIETAPNYRLAYQKKSDLLIKMSRYSDALVPLLSAVKLNSSIAETYSKIGFCLKKLGKSETAYKFYRKVLDTNTSKETYFEALKELRQIRNANFAKNKYSKVKICN